MTDPTKPKEPSSSDEGELTEVTIELTEATRMRLHLLKLLRGRSEAEIVREALVRHFAEEERQAPKEPSPPPEGEG